MKSLEYYLINGWNKDGELLVKDGNGKWTYYNEDGSLKGEGIYQNGLKWSGFFIDYYENGQIKEHGIYKDGEKEGKWTYYNEDGSIDKMEEYKYRDSLNFEEYKYRDSLNFEEYKVGIERIKKDK